jgi:16S rRNA (uracil1498-N3)-methyltransferase
MNLRLFVDAALVAGSEIILPPGATRHAQVRRVQPGDVLCVFDGHGSDWPATVQRVGRSEVVVQLGQPVPVAHELGHPVTLALGMPANERMDTLVEKATELGVAHIQPLLCERSVLRLAGERAQRKCAHWQAIAQAACEQSGRARVPTVAAVITLPDWLAGLPLAAAAETAAAPAEMRLLLSFRAAARPLRQVAVSAGGVAVLSGPEGGLTAAEEGAAQRAGFMPTTLGPRVLRADTAPLAVLAWLGLMRG